MIRLLKIELLKLKYSRYFWILFGLFLIVLVSIPAGIQGLRAFILQGPLGNMPYAKNQFPLFDFEDIWQNLTWLFKLATVFLSALVVINVSREFSSKTARQNIIDGLSRKEFIISKVLLIVFVASIVTLFTLILGLIFGFAYSPVKGADFIFKNISFLGGYWLHLIHDMFLAMTVALLVRKPGIAVMTLIFYTLIDWALYVTVAEYFNFPGLAKLLPNAATKNLIELPFSKYALQKVNDSLQWENIAISLVYVGVLYAVNQWIMNKRDL